MPSIELNGRLVGYGFEPIVIAEIGINHGGSLEEAIKIASNAIDHGAEIIKHQTHIIEDEMSEEAKVVVPGNSSDSIFEIMKTCALNEKDERELMDYIQSRGVTFISTPFSRAAADRLDKFGVTAVKIGSGECNNYPLVKHIAQMGKPVIVSTGMNSIKSIAKTVEILRQAESPYALLHCTNVYPTPHRLVRLGAMSELSEAFPDCVVGLSDHTTDNFACLGAVALGASIVERHFTDTKNRNGPDIICSMDGQEMSDLIKGVKAIALCRGGTKSAVPEEEQTIAFAFSSVVAIETIKPGDRLTRDNIWLRRPANGDFGPSDYDDLIGRRVLHRIPAGSQVKKNHLVD